MVCWYDYAHKEFCNTITRAKRIRGHDIHRSVFGGFWSLKRLKKFWTNSEKWVKIFLNRENANNRRTKQKGILLLVKYGHLRSRCTSDCLLLNWTGEEQAKNVLEWLRYFRKLWDRWSRWKAAQSREEPVKNGIKRRELRAPELSINSREYLIEAVRKLWKIKNWWKKMVFWYIAKERRIAWTNLFIWKMMKRYVTACR